VNDRSARATCGQDAQDARTRRSGRGRSTTAPSAAPLAKEWSREQGHRRVTGCEAGRAGRPLLGAAELEGSTSRIELVTSSGGGDGAFSHIFCQAAICAGCLWACKRHQRAYNGDWESPSQNQKGMFTRTTPTSLRVLGAQILFSCRRLAGRSICAPRTEEQVWCRSREPSLLVLGEGLSQSPL